MEGFWRITAPWLVGLVQGTWTGTIRTATWLRPGAARARSALWRAHKARLDGLARIGVLEALTVLIVLTGAASALVIQHVEHFRALSPVDEIMHLDATFKAPRAVSAGERVDQEALRAAACRRIDSPYAPPPCQTPELNPRDFPANGFNTAYIHPTGYYRVTHWLADQIAPRWGTDDVDSARLAGVVWLAAGLFLLFLLARRLGAPPEAAVGVALLVAAWPPVWYSSAVVNPDATSLPVGAAVLYSAVAWGRSPFGILVLPLAGFAAVEFKLTNILVVGVACGYLLLSALLRSGSWRERGRRLGVATGAAALLAVPAVLLAAAIGRATNERAILPIGVFSTGQYVDELPAGTVLSQWTHFLPPTTLAHAAPFLRDSAETRTFISTLFALTGGLLVAGLLAALANASRNRETLAVALPTLVCMVVGGPLYAMANYATTHGYFSVSARYGYVLIPCSAAVLAGLVSERRFARGLLVLGLAVSVTGIGMAMAA
ncbi:MAG TPA: hypothetical protein VF109_01700 [Mycobacteriales bacterium]